MIVAATAVDEVVAVRAVDDVGKGSSGGGLKIIPPNGVVKAGAGDIFDVEPSISFGSAKARVVGQIDDDCRRR